MKKLSIITIVTMSLLLLGLMPIITSASGSVAGPGDAAIIGYNADGNDNIAFVILGDTTAGQVIYFTDNEWNGNAIGNGGAFTSGEGYITWTAPSSPLPAGTVIEISNVSTTPSATQGTASRNGQFNLSSKDEVLYAYLGTAYDTPTAFLGAFANDDFASGTLTNTALIEGTNALRFDTLDSDVDVASYIGPRNNQDTASDYLAQIMDTGNWNNQDGGGDQSSDGIAPDVPFDTTTFEKSNAVTFSGISAFQGPSNTVIILSLLGFSILLFGGFWLRRRTPHS